MHQLHSLWCLFDSGGDSGIFSALLNSHASMVMWSRGLAMILQRQVLWWNRREESNCDANAQTTCAHKLCNYSALLGIFRHIGASAMQWWALWKQTRFPERAITPVCTASRRLVWKKNQVLSRFWTPDRPHSYTDRYQASSSTIPNIAIVIWKLPQAVFIFRSILIWITSGIFEKISHCDLDTTSGLIGNFQGSY